MSRTGISQLRLKWFKLINFDQFCTFDIVKRIKPAYPLLFVLWVTMTPDQPWHWRSQLAIGVTVALAFLAVKIHERVHWSAAIPFFISGCSAAFCTFSPHSPYVEYEINSQNIFYAASAQSLVLLLSVTLPILLIDHADLVLWLDAFCFSALLNSIGMILEFVLHMQPGGIMNNPSVDATFIALTLPAIFYRLKDKPLTHLKWTFALLIVAATIISKSNTGLAIICFEGILYVTLRFKKSLYTALAIFASLPTILAIQILLGDKFAHSSGRYSIWKISIAQWVDLHRYIFGTGSGTFRVLGPQAQRLNLVGQDWIWMHNEPLQVLFEQGIIGLLALCILFVYMLKGSKQIWLKVTVLAMFVGSLTQMPFRMYPFALFYALVCRLSLLSFSNEERA